MVHALRRATAAGTLVLGLTLGGASAQQTVGLFVNEPESFQGYTLITPLASSDTYLIDNGGHVVHAWTASGPPGLMAYLLEDGHLLRSRSLGNGNDPAFSGAQGNGGKLEEYLWPCQLPAA
jgi:hypothetical protein